MRKDIITPESQGGKSSGLQWIDVENLARTEISSEDAAHPIESALRSGAGPGWRAAQPGPQTIRLIFDAPIKLRLVRVEFHEPEVARTQEFVLRWSADQGRTYREIVRQQYNFNPPGTTSEQEEYEVDLAGVTALELGITPAMGRSDVRASLAQLLLA
ncbi:MAG TPA: hypothetical protein VIK40_00815 [Geomonas sp.]|jgi:hypothetical protein